MERFKMPRHKERGFISGLLRRVRFAQPPFSRTRWPPRCR
jgi:hypothetical protein